MRKRSRLISIDSDAVLSSVKEERQYYIRYNDYHGNLKMECWIENGIFHQTFVKRQTTTSEWGNPHYEIITTSHRQKAEINFEDVCNNVAVVFDDTTREPPWDDGTIWRHRQQLPLHEEEYKSVRFVKTQDGTPDFLITLIDSEDSNSREARFARFRNDGASKQVAAEMVAQQDRLCIEQLKDWYINGFDSWYVITKFPAPFEVVNDSVFGIDDEDYANSIRSGFIETFCLYAKNYGWKIIGGPTEAEQLAKQKKARLESARARFRTNLNLFNWSYDGSSIRRGKSR